MRVRLNPSCSQVNVLGDPDLHWCPPPGARLPQGPRAHALHHRRRRQLPQRRYVPPLRQLVVRLTHLYSPCLLSRCINHRLHLGSHYALGLSHTADDIYALQNLPGQVGDEVIAAGVVGEPIGAVNLPVNAIHMKVKFTVTTTRASPLRSEWLRAEDSRLGLQRVQAQWDERLLKLQVCLLRSQLLAPPLRSPPRPTTPNWLWSISPLSR